MAAALLGRARTTKDIDLVIRVSPGRIEEILDAVEGRGLQVHRRDFIANKFSENGVAKITWFKRKYSVDLRRAIFELDKEAISDAKPHKLMGVETYIAAPEEMIVYKLARFDEIDRGDIIGILRMQDELDWKRIDRLARDFSIETGNELIRTNLITVKSWIRSE